MDKLLIQELLKFANDKANEVEDISIEQLEDLVVAGAKWMHDKLNPTIDISEAEHIIYEVE